MENKLQNRLNFGRLQYLVVGCAAAVLLAGGYPAYRYAGWPGVISAVVAAAIVLAVMIASEWFVLRVQRKSGTLAATQVLFGAAVVRIPVTVALALGAKSLARLPAKPLLLWVAFLYVLLVVVESVWLSRKLKSQETHECRVEHTGGRESP